MKPLYSLLPMLFLVYACGDNVQIQSQPPQPTVIETGDFPEESLHITMTVSGGLPSPPGPNGEYCNRIGHYALTAKEYQRTISCGEYTSESDKNKVLNSRQATLSSSESTTLIDLVKKIIVDTKSGTPFVPNPNELEFAEFADSPHMVIQLVAGDISITKEGTMHDSKAIGELSPIRDFVETLGYSS
jgi:hypothetical protein